MSSNDTVMGPRKSSRPGPSAASTSLFEVHAGDETQITYGNGNNPFTLDSIDFAPLLKGGSGQFTFVVTGVFPDQSFIKQTVTINNSPLRLQTVTFPSTFTNVVEVHFLQGTIAGTLGQPDEMEPLLNVLVRLRLPTVVVLGNHDYESGKEEELKRMMTNGGIKVLDGSGYERDGVGFVGRRFFGESSVEAC